MRNILKNLFVFVFSIYISLILVSIGLYYVEYQNIVNINKKIYLNCKKLFLDCEKKNLHHFYLNKRKELPNLSVYTPPIHSLRVKKFVEEKVFPISGVSNSKTLVCNEIGEYIFIESDKYGFNNINSWNDKIDVTLVGDSFAFGECVDTKNNIASKLTDNNFKTISLGYGSNGPLISLASIREYFPMLKSKEVFWIFFGGNDMGDLQIEKKSKLLKNYLNINFMQNLSEQQSFIDKTYREFFEYESNRLENSWPYKFSLVKFFNLSIPRNFLINFINNRKISNNNNNLIINFRDIIDNYDFDLLSQIFNVAKIQITNANSNLVFVYIPDPSIYKSKDIMAFYQYQKEKIFKIISSHNIQIIDFEEKFLNSKLDFDQIYSMGTGHLTKDGYKIVSLEIQEYLKNK